MTKICILGLGIGILLVLFESLAEINTAYLSSLERGSTGPGPGWSVIAYFQIHQHSELDWMTWSAGTGPAPGFRGIGLTLESCRKADPRFLAAKAAL